MATDQRKIDWVRIILAYSIPFITLIGLSFVGYYRLAEAEGKVSILDTQKVSVDVHDEVHKAVDVKFTDFEKNMIKLDARIEQVNYAAIKRHDSAMQEQRTSTKEIIQAIKDK